MDMSGLWDDGASLTVTAVKRVTGLEGGMTGAPKTIVHIDNERVTVTELRFQQDDATGWHRHEHDYVIVPLLDGKLRIETRNGSAFSEMKKGLPYFRHAGVEHDVISINEGEYAFIEIEIKK
jgi:quercetin dioxygenase-like cupin family protein